MWLDQMIVRLMAGKRQFRYFFRVVRPLPLGAVVVFGLRAVSQ
jgi:hypothetical protein